VGCHALGVEWTGAHVEPGDGAAGLALATGQPAVSGEGVPPRLPGARSAVAVPLLDGGDVRGALTVGFGTAHDLDEGALRALEALADLAVVACRNHEAYERLQTAASTDPLTGLLNHGAMQSRLREEIARARRDRQPLACVIIDLDDFKGVNDRHGHLAGDELLRAVAGALTDTLRPYDQVARYGGDEFVLVLPGTDEMEARTIAERARDAICARALPGRTGANAGCSLGVAAWKEPMTSDDLLAQSDGALLLAKRTGKGRVAVADADVERGLALAAAGDGSPAAVQALAAAIEARDAYTRDHSEDVVRLATGVALMYGLDAEAVERIGHAALIHDVGKLAVPGELLHREGPLTPEEWRLVAEHPVMGERILRRAPALSPLAPLVRHEHEHWDGSGYPDGLRGTRIPLGSRIVLACDAYCAMVAPRPYRPALTEREAIAELRRRAGTQFDPQVVAALLDVLGVESSL
jgi:diguanylate cyclase (GGDEF)-like protein